MADQPLHGLNIGITRQDAAEFAARLVSLGANPLIYPAIMIVDPPDWQPFDAAFDQFETFDWMIVTSRNTVQALQARMRAEHLQGKLPRCAAVGPATAAALHSIGLPVALVPQRHTAAGLVAELGSLHGQRIWLPQSAIAPPYLAQALRQAGANVTLVTAYTTIAHPLLHELTDQLQQQQIDLLTFFSASAVDYLLDTLSAAERTLLHAVTLASIGPSTSHALRSYELPVTIEAVPHTLDGMLEALIAWRRTACNNS